MKSSLLTTLILGLTLATGYGFERNQDLLKQLSRSTFLRRAEPSLPMKSLLLAFRLQNEDQLFQLLNEQQNPASPLYHKWLTPEEFGDRFGAPDRIYQSAVQWLTDQGFHNIRTGASRQSIYFDGDASRVERAFAVQIGVYNYEGKKHYSNNREAVIPLQYESAVLALFLDDFDDFAPLYRGGSYDYMSPRDLRTAYNFTPLYNRGVTGKGQSIAIVARSDFDLADVQRFRSLFGLSKNDPQKVLVGTNPGNLGSDEEQEVLLDAEWAGAVAPDATVQVVISPTLDISSSVSHILNSPDLQGARIMSISFGGGETAGNTKAYFFNQLFSQAAVQGVTVLVSSGDDGAQQVVGSTLSSGFDVNFLCATPYVTCVGGTRMNSNFDSDGNYIAYAGETAWSGSGGGKSVRISKPSFQYGPGVPSDGFRDVPDVAALASSPYALIEASGTLSEVAGTSLSAPIWAGVFALVNQAGAPGGTGNANPRLYELGRNQHQSGGAAVFNDVISGSNGTAKVAGFSAGAGYDQVTGWGSPDGDVLVSNFFSPATGSTMLASGKAISSTIAAVPSTSSACGLSDVQYSIDVPAGAIHLIVELEGDDNLDLYLRMGQAVSETSGILAADFRSQSSLPTEIIYIGPQSTPPLVAGRYYVGVANCADRPVNFLLKATAVTSTSSPVTEELALDDGGVETGLAGNGIIALNRLTPRRYPSSLKTIRVFVSRYQGQPDPINQQFRLIAYSDPSGTGHPPASSTRLIDQIITVSGENGFLDFSIPNGPEIGRGDWYVGMEYLNPGNGVLAAADVNGTQADRSYISLDGGVTYSAATVNGQKVNLMIRAVVDSPMLARPPRINSFTAVDLSDGSVRLTISGQDPDGDAAKIIETRFDSSGNILGTETSDVRALIGGRTSFTLYYTIQTGDRLSDTKEIDVQLQDGTGLFSEIESAGVWSGIGLSVPAGGAAVSSTGGTTGNARVGYGTLAVKSGDPPYGTAVIAFKQNGVVVSETAVPASPPTTSARIFVEYRTIPTSTGTISINTGVAIVNTSNSEAIVSFDLFSTDGTSLTKFAGYGRIPAKSHRAAFVDQLGSIAPLFFPNDFGTRVKFGMLRVVSYGYQAAQPLSIVALRLTTNQRGETLLSTTPVIDDRSTQSALPVYFPRLVDGGGWKTSLVLLNASSAAENGTLKIYAKDGSPLSVRRVGETEASSHFRYSINSGCLYLLETDGSPTGTGEGSVQVVPDAGTTAPVGAGILSYSSGGVLVTESGVPSAALTRHARIYVDQSGGHLTGLAIANPGTASMTVDLSAYELDGVTPAGQKSGNLTLAPNGEEAAFANSLVSNLPDGFTGVLDISSTSPFSALTLRALSNSRGDFLITTFPIADYGRPAANPVVFPQVVDGLSGGLYQTQFVLLGTGSVSNLTLELYGDDGFPVPMLSEADMVNGVYFYADEDIRTLHQAAPQDEVRRRMNK